MPNDKEPDVGGLDWLKSQMGGAEEEEAEKSPGQAKGPGAAPGVESGAIPGATATAGPAEPTPAAQPGAFNWGLRPTTAPDPKLAPAPPVARPPVVPPTPVTPDAAEAEKPRSDEEPPTPDSPFTGQPATRVIRSETDLEPAPWWTTPVQTPLVPTAEEWAAATTAAAAAEPTALLRTPVPMTSGQATPTPTPTPTGFGAPTGVAPSALGVAPVAPTAPTASTRHSSDRGPSGGRTANTSTRTLIWIAAGLLVVIMLVGLFFLGQILAGGGAPIASTTPSATASETPIPTPTVEATGPQPAGVHKWDALRGGECLQPYTSPWDEEFTVADCAAGHAGQLVYRGIFAGDATTAFPGEEALAAQINLLCSASGVIDLAAAGAFPDVQVQGSYPITDEQWTGGERHYYCFVSRASAEPFTASIAGPGPAPAG